MKILHIIKELNSSLPLELLKAHSKDADLHVLLLHDAVLLPPESFPASAKLFVGDRDAEARNVEGVTRLSYEEIIDLVCACERVISW